MSENDTPPIISNEVSTSSTKLQSFRNISEEEHASAWNSINIMLIQNRCWLCQAQFQRGKQKKVFQVSDLLNYCGERMAYDVAASNSANNNQEQDKIIVNSEVELEINLRNTSIPGENVSNNEKNATNDDITKTFLNLPDQEKFVAELSSSNFRLCYESYFDLMKYDEGKGIKLRSILKENDVDVWMSGLVCGQNITCLCESGYFVNDPKSKKNTKSNEMKNKSGVFSFINNSSDKDCGPGCGCDNPWAFLS